MKSLLLLLFVFFGLTASATTYYVSSSGNDANNGTSTTTPWRTISKINNSTFLPGDFILFRRGDSWREELIIPSSGLAGNPITFSAYGNGAKPVINGADLITNWVSAGTNIWSIASTLPGWAMVIVDDSIYAEASSISTLSPGKYFIGSGTLYIYSTTNPNTRKAEVSKREFCIHSRSTDLRHHVNIIGLEMRYAGGGFGADGNGTHFPGFITIDSCHFYANRLWGCLTRDGHDNDTFKNSTATYNGNGFYAWISDNCTMSHDSSAHSIVYGNTDGGAFQSYQGSGWLVENCFSNDDNDAIHIDAGGLPCNAIIRYNKVFNSKFGNPNTPGMGVGSVAAGGTIQIYYNLIVNCASAGFECYAASNGKILFYNNTIYLNNSTGSNGTVYLAYGQNFVFKNNIIVRDYVKDNTLFAIIKTPSMSENDHNLYYTFNDPGSHFRTYYNGYYNTITAWRSATNQDANSINTDPLLVNVASDWRLQTGSPCINTGVDVGLTRDILGNPIVGLPDMGAYEQTSGNSAPTANAGNDIVLTLPANSTTLSGSGSDIDGTIASYAWTRVSGPTTFSLGSPNAATTTLNNLVQGIYTFRLTITDNSGAPATDDVTVTVNAAANQPPAANAGNDIVLTLPANSTTLSGSGSDVDGTIASYAWSRVSGPTTFNLGSPNAATTTLNNLVQGIYTFRLTVIDNSGATAADDVTVTVNAAANQPPTANAGNDIVLTLPANSTTLSGSGSDVDGTIASYDWSWVSGPTTFNLGSPNAATTTLNNLVQGIYTLRLTVTDNSGATATDDITVTVNPAANQPPAANAGNDIVLTLPANSTTLSGSGSDVDGTIASYAWSRVSGPTTFNLGSPNAATTTLNNLVQGIYTLRLTVTDNDGATATDDVTVTVNAAANQLPAANAGNDIVLTLPANSTTLNGSGSDVDGTIASYAWSRVSGPTTFNLGSPNAATTTLNNLVQGIYTLRLTVTDNDGATATDDVTVTVNAAPNQVPTANAGNDIALTLPANSTTLNGSGSDVDGTIASYAWSWVSGPTTFSLGTANAATTTLNNLVQGIYTFRLTVTDNRGATSTDDVTVTVNAAANQPPAANAGIDINLTLPNNSTTLSGSGSDVDGTIASYAWSRVSGPTTFNLGSPNAATTTLNNLVQGIYTLRLTVTDNSGATGTDDVTVTVNAAANQPPAANAGNDIVLTLPANSTTLSGSGSDVDGTIASYAWSRVNGPTTFNLGSPNAATTTLNNLVQGIYTLRLTVTDNSGATATDDVTVTVNAAPNEVPIANAGIDINLTLPNNSTTLSGSGSDVDGTIASYAWSWVSGPTTFNLGSPNAATTTLNNLIQGIYTLRLAVTDNSGATATDDVTVTVNAAPNVVPTANAGNDINLTLPANSTTLSGSGSDVDGTIASYNWSWVSGPTTFNLGSPNAAATTLNNLVQGIYTLRLTVTDNSGATATDDVTVTVNAASNQVPTANAGNDINLTLPANSTTLDGSGSDVDGTIASYAWSRVSGPTTFNLGSPNTATTTLNNLIQGIYTLRLTVTDNSGATATDDVTVTVNAAPNQVPIANAGIDINLTLPNNSTTLNGSGSDVDGTIASYDWSWVSGPTTFNLGSPNAATTTLNNLIQGIYTLRLTVTDNSGATATDDVTVTVNAAPNRVPTANAGIDINLTLPNNSTTLNGSGSDVDGTIASYAWSQVSGPTTFNLGSPNTATTTLNNLIQGIYTLRLTVTDNSGATATDDVTVTVNAEPNQVPIANAGIDINLTLPNNSTTLNGSGSDVDGTIASYDWSWVSGSTTFNLGSPNAATTTLNNLIQGIYTLRLTVTDNRGATATDDVTVTVNAAPNQVPIANAGIDINLTLPNNSTTLSGSGSDVDGTIASYAWNRVSGPTTFSLGSADAATTTLNNLVQGIYTLRLTVTDNSGATATDDVTVTVNAAANQPPAANAGPDQTIVLPSNSVTLDGNTSYDPDGTISGYQWQQVSGPNSSTFSSTTAPTITVSNLTEGTYTYQLTVRDNDDATGTATVKVTVLSDFRISGPVAIFPNPARDVINIALTSDSSATVLFNILDGQGRIVMPTMEMNMPQGFFVIPINISRLQAGIYTLECLENKNKKIIARFVRL